MSNRYSSLDFIYINGQKIKTSSHLSVLSRETNPDDITILLSNDRYWIDGIGVGNWFNQDYNIAIYKDGIWEFEETQIGSLAYVEEDEEYYYFDGVNLKTFSSSVSSSNVGINIEDSGTLIQTDTTKINFNNNLSVSDGGNDSVIVDTINNAFLKDIFTIDLTIIINNYIDLFQIPTGVILLNNNGLNLPEHLDWTISGNRITFIIHSENIITVGDKIEVIYSTS